MKRYISCFLFFFCLTGGCLVALFYLTMRPESKEVQEVQVTETYEEPVFAESAGTSGSEVSARAAEEEAETIAHLVLNQERVAHSAPKGVYCLMAEEGYLIVYDERQETVSLFTHMPLSEFPEHEQERLMEGIWFFTMAEIFSYLESYSS